MDIGAMVCTKNTPDCAHCPAADICKGHSTPETFPAAKKKKAVPVRHKHVAIISDSNGRIYCTPRTTRFLGGLYHFLEVEAKHETAELNGHIFDFAHSHKIGEVTHSYSHFTLHASIYHFTLEVAMNGDEWVEKAHIPTLALSRADSKAWALLAS